MHQHAIWGRGSPLYVKRAFDPCLSLKKLEMFIGKWWMRWVQTDAWSVSNLVEERRGSQGSSLGSDCQGQGDLWVQAKHQTLDGWLHTWSLNVLCISCQIVGVRGKYAFENFCL